MAVQWRKGMNPARKCTEQGNRWSRGIAGVGKWMEQGKERPPDTVGDEPE